jgi:hypothetical protein
MIEFGVMILSTLIAGKPRYKG